MKIRLAVMLIGALSAPPAYAQSAQDGRTCQTVMVTLAYTLDESAEQIRHKFADLLSRLLSDRPACAADRNVMTALLPLLADRDVYIRSLIAIALGNAGPAAKAAVPALEQTLTEARAAQKTRQPQAAPWWGDEVLKALEKITGRKYPPLQ